MTLEDEKRTFQLQVAEFSAVTRTDTRSQRHLERRSLPRRVFLGRLGAFAATVTALSVLPRNRALAYPPPYTTFPELNQYGAGGTCFVDAGCDGPSADFIDNGYCANCSDAAGRQQLVPVAFVRSAIGHVLLRSGHEHVRSLRNEDRCMESHGQLPVLHYERAIPVP